VASCIGIALGLLDDWMSGQDPAARTRLSRHTRLPAGHWNGERAATDILVLAGKGKAFRSLAWAQLTDTPAHLISALIH